MALTHHAYFYEGEVALLSKLVSRIRAEEKYESTSPDFFERTYERFGIDEARELQSTATFKSISGRGLFIIAASAMTTEAQQALLKLFEEPQRGIVFILLIPHGALLPTLRSRCLPLPFEMRENTQTISQEIGEFLKSPYKQRTEIIAELLDEDEYVRERARIFLNELEQSLYQKLPNSKGDAKQRLIEGLGNILKLRSYTTDRSPSLKMILEHLAATLPKT